jgi:hypothetical protein
MDNVQNISNDWSEYTNGTRTVNTTTAIMTNVVRGFTQIPRQITGTLPRLSHDRSPF